MFVYMLMIDSPEDRSKFQKLYTEYRELMYAVANNILHNHFDAEDAVHQAFLKIIDHIEEIEDPICPKTKSYVVTIAENKAIDAYRRKQRHPLVEYNDDNVGIVIEYDGSNIFGKCLSELPAKYREVLLLKYLHGYTFKETADILAFQKVMRRRSRSERKKSCLPCAKRKEYYGNNR